MVLHPPTAWLRFQYPKPAHIATPSATAQHPSAVKRQNATSNSRPSVPSRVGTTRT